MSRAVAMAALIFAGEAVFFLPFVLARIFRPTMLSVLGLTNTQLGVAFSLYGIVAMIAYFPGGPLADRFAARGLMVMALIATAAGGLLLLGQPSVAAIQGVYAVWGLTTILLFWAPLLRATRRWGGGQAQGRAFGLLDGGRGLVAAVIASASVVVFGWIFPAGVASADPTEVALAFDRIVWVFIGITLAAALAVWFGVPGERPVGTATPAGRSRRDAVATLVQLAKRPAIWCQAVIVICGYVGYKSLDDVSLYANVVLGMDQIESARASSFSMWCRPPVAILAGILADRLGVVRMVAAGFVLMVIGAASAATEIVQPGFVGLAIAVMVATSTAVFALRGLYFALTAETGVPLATTGSAVGIVSVIGYTPDVFMGPLMGVVLDWNPGPAGHRLFFAIVAGFALAGLIATVCFSLVTSKFSGSKSNESDC